MHSWNHPHAFSRKLNQTEPCHSISPSSSVPPSESPEAAAGRLPLEQEKMTQQRKRLVAGLSVFAVATVMGIIIVIRTFGFHFFIWLVGAAVVSTLALVVLIVVWPRRK
jgi:hypothetical protein